MMGELIQYDFFKTREESEMDAMRKQCNDTLEMMHKMRKKLFAENGSTKKQLYDVTERLAILERNICKGVT